MYINGCHDSLREHWLSQPIWCTPVAGKQSAALHRAALIILSDCLHSYLAFRLASAALTTSSISHLCSPAHILIGFGRAEPLRNHVRFSPMPSEHDWRAPATSASPRSSSPVRIDLDPSSSNGDLVDNANPNLNGVDPARAKWAQKGTDAQSSNTRQACADYVVRPGSVHSGVASFCFLVHQQNRQHAASVSKSC